jgi:hypothetical protein
LDSPVDVGPARQRALAIFSTISVNFGWEKIEPNFYIKFSSIKRMSEITATDIAPMWVWQATGGCVAATIVSLILGTPIPGLIETLLAGAALGVLYILYRWGKVGERDPGDELDTDMKAQAERSSHGRT